MKALQIFTNEYLKKCSEMTADQKLKFLEDFRKLHFEKKEKTPSKLISIKVPIDLLNAFKQKAKLESVPYQTQIKKLMKEWLLKSNIQ
ncbi:MAG: hypothetical protein D6797_08775 [Bdellovibrio sp.]|nr:MAG: hypothetical protein D6797_08775 [Bdellovibrio sp.]